VGILDMIASDNARFATILEFSSAVLIAFLSRCCMVRFKNLGLCYIALTLGSLTQLLPGTYPKLLIVPPAVLYFFLNFHEVGSYGTSCSSNSLP
jgi:hypothetical protein